MIAGEGRADIKGKNPDTIKISKIRKEKSKLFCLCLPLSIIAPEMKQKNFILIESLITKRELGINEVSKHREG